MTPELADESVHGFANTRKPAGQIHAMLRSPVEGEQVRITSRTRSVSIHGAYPGRTSVTTEPMLRIRDEELASKAINSSQRREPHVLGTRQFRFVVDEANTKTVLQALFSAKLTPRQTAVSEDENPFASKPALLAARGSCGQVISFPSLNDWEVNCYAWAA